MWISTGNNGIPNRSLESTHPSLSHDPALDIGYCPTAKYAQRKYVNMVKVLLTM